jgi:glycosyltransferase involved in cell wall biosynthesis
MTYERSKYLLNLVKSIEDNFCFDYDLVIMDDGSVSENMSSVLSQLNNKYKVRINQKSGASRKHKGLYDNMNEMLSYADQNNYQYLFVIQDDIQAIRKIDQQELNSVLSVFNSNNIAQIVPLFFKANRKENYKLQYNVVNSLYYLAAEKFESRRGLTDVGIFDLEKLKKRKWIFGNSELDNINKSIKENLFRVKYVFPFLAHLPWPSTKRYKLTSPEEILKLLTDYFYKAGFHPLRYMKEDQLRQFLKKESYEFPYAEDYLELREDISLVKPWNYYSSTFPIKQKTKQIIGK